MNFLEFAVITGCLRISRESIFTGLNNLEIHSVLSHRYDSCFGFTEDEVKAMLHSCGLSEKYPEQKLQFEQNYQALLQKIDSIADRAKQVLDHKKDKIFLIYHPALTYFAADYGMEQISIEDEGKEPNPAHLKKIIDLALEKNIHMIFIQSQFDVNNAESVAKQIGGQIIQIDPLTENWTAEMNRLIDTLDKYLPEK